MNRLTLLPMLVCLAIVSLSPFSASAATPFRLLTMETSSLPDASGVIGLQTAGLRIGDVFVDTNLLYDLGLNENIGVKYARALSSSVAVTVGARYLQFVGSSLAESVITKQYPQVQHFGLSYGGPMAFVGASTSLGSVGTHLNIHYANISGSRVFGLVAGASLPFWDVWSGVGEAGYDFANSQPRLSLGVERNGPSFGFRFGVTYVKITDPFLNYTGVAPVIDFFWLLGSR